MRLFLLALLLLLLAPLAVALAADPASLTSSPQAFADALTAALAGGQYRVAVGIVLAGLVWLLRDKFLASLPGRLGDWLRSPRGGVVTIMVAGALATLSLRLLAAPSLCWVEVPGLLINCVATGLMAAGGWSVVTKWQAKAPPAAPVAALLCLLLSSSACTPRQIVAWKELRADAAGCLAPGAKAAMSGAVDNAIKELSGVDKSVDWKAYGIGLAANYGGSLALCIVAAAIDRLGPVILGGMAPGDPRVALRWLDANRNEWLP